jgi:hypothetical protein
MEVSIKKEKTDEGTSAEELEPELPSLTGTGTERTRKMKSQDAEQPSKRLKSADTEEWLEDVVCTGQTVINPESAAENEVQRYLGAKIAEGDQGLSALEWWEKKMNSSSQELAKLQKNICQFLDHPYRQNVFSVCVGNL